MKKKLIIMMLVIFAGFIKSQSLEEIIASASKEPFLKNSQFGIYAKYADNDEVIFGKDENFSLAPASGLKVFTSSAALEILGDNYKFVTKLYYDGTISKDNILMGNIYIVGGGDPTLGSNLVKGSMNLKELIDSWIDGIREKGIDKIEGTIIADDLLFEGNTIPDAWVYGDMGNYYGASCSPLTINDNLYSLFFKPGKSVGSKAEVLRTEPPIEGLTFTNYMLTGKEGSGDNGYIYSAPFQYNAILRGTIPAGVKEFSIKGAMPEPPLFAARYLFAALNKAGISVKHKPYKLNKKIEYNPQNLLVTHYSPALKDIVYIINKRSNNLYTEMLLRAVGLSQNKEGSTEAGIESLKEYLVQEGINIEGLNLEDGCGLARSNTITAKMMVDVLELATRKKSFESFYWSLGITGDPDDISYYSKFGVGTELAFNGRIKSGSINKVRSHSGYIKDKTGRLIIFSIITNNYSGSSKQVEKLHVDVMIALARLGETKQP